MLTEETASLPKGLKILLVEDDVIAQQVCASFLKDLGYNIDIAETGRKALDFVEQYSYDLLLLDIGLPDIDGYTVAKTIRQSEEAPERNIHIVAITAHVLDSDKAACFEAGINDFINKPILRASLKRVLLDYNINRS